MKIEVKTMDWSRFNIDGWLEQYGAYLNTVVSKGGDLPDGLHINQIYYLMVKSGAAKIKNNWRFVDLQIGDFEAYYVERLLRDVMNRPKDVIYDAVVLLIKHKVEGKTQDQLSQEFGKSQSSIHSTLSLAKGYISGWNRKIKVDTSKKTRYSKTKVSQP